jgi:hypothetical protein
MSGGIQVDRRPARAIAGLLGAGVMIVALVLGSVVPAAASSTARVWVARLGAGGANGTVVVTLPAGAPGTIAVALKGLPAASLVSGSVRRGTCSAPGAVVAALPGGRANAVGRLSRKRTPGAREASAIAGASSLVATLRAGSVRRCAVLVERVAPPPSPTPTPATTDTPGPTATATPGPSATSAPVQVGQRFMVNGQYYLTVFSVDQYTDPLGQTAAVVGVQFDSFSSGIEVASSQFTLVEPDGSLRSPVYCIDCAGTDPWPPKPWTVSLERGGQQRRLLAFPAPVLGRLDLKFGSLTIRIR